MGNNITKFLLICGIASAPLANASAQGWPNKYDGVMLQGFYWDSYVNTQWSALEAQADAIAPWFSLIWVPNSGNCATSGNVMGYAPVYWYDHNSSFGSEGQLRSMIRTYKEKGTGFLLDAVINHRSGANSWMSFPAETNPDDGKSYQMTGADVCCTDEVNSDRSAGYEYGSATGAEDTGSDFNGARDLDHTSANVQKNVIAYLKYCRENLGFAGFRYDMVKGYSGSYINMYNKAVFGGEQILSVGEYWDGSVASVGNWLNETKGEGGAPSSAAFDFPLKFSINACCNYGGYYGDNLSGSSKALMRSASFRRYAVTFVENHDTNYEQNGSGDALRRDTLAANAFIMGAPGTPCVFLTHWKRWAPEIQNLIRARREAGILNTSSLSELKVEKGEKGYFAWSCADLVGVVGYADSFDAPEGYTAIINHPYRHYAYYLKNSREMAWCDAESQTIDHPIVIRLSAVSNAADAKVVYTLDGTQPGIGNGTKVSSGTALVIDRTCTLRYALVSEGNVSRVEERKYVYAPFIAHDASIYVSTSLPADWDAGYCNFHVWDSENHQLTTNGWPGDKKEFANAQNMVKTSDGKTWYKVTFPIKSSDYYVNIVCSTGGGTPQTVDFTGIKNDVYLEINGQMLNEKYYFEDVTGNYNYNYADAVISPSVTKGDFDSMYDISGRRIIAPFKGYPYIKNNRKYLNQ